MFVQHEKTACLRQDFLEVPNVVAFLLFLKKINIFFQKRPILAYFFVAWFCARKVLLFF